ncbi:MFS transporter [Vibrio sp. SS-MA-C1-2]|uniref:MFS transporter n=1 Tax=Vibrio sp. SS-MA-C1-2 TaxID=2908646 RepID=UPI001F2B5D27|nr:MFS transporter [Vibrio sp. SS-MA-C1-2]UJF18933.1 MFS transporter [Vibrio sp. SS-MA-C1-2]
MNNNNKFNIRTVLIACLIVSIGQFSVGLVFPALPWIADSFHLGTEDVQGIVSVYLLGFGPSQLLYGPISDAIGRKPILISGLALSILGVIFIVFGAHHFELVLIGRFIQGVGAGCVAVLARACIRDSYSGSELANAMGWLTIVASFTPIVAPVFGGLINHYFGWIAIFIGLLSYMTIIWLLMLIYFKETLTKPVTNLSLKNSLITYRSFALSRHFLSFATIGWLNYLLVVIAISVIPFVMQRQIGMDSEQYAIWSIFPAFGLMFGGVISNRFRPKIGMKRMMLLSPIVQLSAGVWLFVAPLDPVFVISGHFFLAMANGIAFPCAQTMLLLPYGKNAGSAAALSGACQMLLAALLSTLLVHLGVSESWHLGAMMILVSVLGLILILWGFKGKEAQELIV